MRKTIFVTVGSNQFSELITLIDKEEIHLKSELRFEHLKKKEQIIATIQCDTEDEYTYVKERLEAKLII